MAIIAFDCDYTLCMAPGGRHPNYEVIDILRNFHALGHTIYIWSGGGAEYAQKCARNLGIYRYCEEAVAKNMDNAKLYGIDIAFDDENVTLGKVNIKVGPPMNKTGL